MTTEPIPHKCTHCGHVQNEIPLDDNFGFVRKCTKCFQGDLLPLCALCGVEIATDGDYCHECAELPPITRRSFNEKMWGEIVEL